MKKLFAVLLALALVVTTLTMPALAKTKTVKTTKVTLSETGTVTLEKGKTLQLTATLRPKNSTQAVKWSTSNKKIATVNSKGKVTAKKAGTATITAKSGKKSAKVKVKVVPAPEKRKEIITYLGKSVKTAKSKLGLKRKSYHGSGWKFYYTGGFFMDTATDNTRNLVEWIEMVSDSGKYCVAGCYVGMEYSDAVATLEAKGYAGHGYGYFENSKYGVTLEYNSAGKVTRINAGKRG